MTVAIIIFAPGYVSQVLNDGEALAYATIVPFMIGFFIAFTCDSIIQDSLPPNGPPVISSGVMSGFSGYDHRARHWKKWFISAAAGVVNLIALALVYDLFS